MRRTLQIGGIDVAHTLQMIGIYGADPTFRRGPEMFAKAVLTPAGPGTMRLTWNRSGDLTAEAWGTGAQWLLERAPHWVGLTDDIGGFDPTLDDRVADLWRRHPGLRLAAIGVVWAGAGARAARPAGHHRGGGEELESDVSDLG